MAQRDFTRPSTIYAAIRLNLALWGQVETYIRELGGSVLSVESSGPAEELHDDEDTQP